MTPFAPAGQESFPSRGMSSIDAIDTIRTNMAFALCVAMSLFHLYTAGIGLLQTPVQRAIHVGFVLVLVFLTYPLRGRGGWIDALLILCAAVGTGYIALFSDAIALRGGKVLRCELVLGLLTILCVLEAGRRVLGRTLPLLGFIFLLYCRYGRYAPSIFMHRGYSLERIVQHMYLTTEGVFGVAVGVSSTFIFLFILFGAFLSNSGGARFFNNLALSLTGRSPGGPAKVAIVASGLLGTINGSSIANVATTGAFTIPLMKKAGYTPEEAGAIEACASTGGQLMPPIMGAGAFVMSEFLNVPYARILSAAIIPALLYYSGLFLNVHLRARRAGLRGFDGEAPDVRQVLKEDGHLLLPILLIVVMLMRSYTPLKAAFWAILLMVGIAALRRHTRMGPRLVVRTLADGARSAVGTGIACAVVGFVVGGSSLTALGPTLSDNILDLAGGALFPTLILAMAACLLLGMGLPTTANYIVTSTVVVPALVKMGVPPLSAHLFVFYFGIMADISPPVCLASFTAAGIAGADAARTGGKALLFALSSFLLPYLFVYSPAILMQGSSRFSVLEVAVGASAGVFAFAVGLQGWWGVRLTFPLRMAAFFAGVLCFLPFLSSRLAGIALLAGLGYAFYCLGRERLGRQ